MYSTRIFKISYSKKRPVGKAPEIDIVRNINAYTYIYIYMHVYARICMYMGADREIMQWLGRLSGSEAATVGEVRDGTQ